MRFSFFNAGRYVSCSKNSACSELSGCMFSLLRTSPRVYPKQRADSPRGNWGGRHLDGVKQEMPGRVHKRVDERGGEDRTAAAPGQTVKDASDGCEDDVAPVRKMLIGDVRKAEENRRDRKSTRLNSSH